MTSSVRCLRKITIDYLATYQVPLPVCRVPQMTFLTFLTHARFAGPTRYQSASQKLHRSVCPKYATLYLYARVWLAFIRHLYIIMGRVPVAALHNCQAEARVHILYSNPFVYTASTVDILQQYRSISRLLFHRKQAISRNPNALLIGLERPSKFLKVRTQEAL